MGCYHYLCLTLIIGCVIFQDVSGVVRVKRSANENLRDPGTYIVHFKDSTTDAQLQHFVKQLNRRSNKTEKFDAKIVAEYPIIKCLTARLSEGALQWVRNNNIKINVNMCNKLTCIYKILVIFHLCTTLCAGYMSQTGFRSKGK